jgi:hypothetical protein
MNLVGLKIPEISGQNWATNILIGTKVIPTVVEFASDDCD